MDYLEDFFVRRKLVDDAIVITEITERSSRTGKVQRSTQDFLARRSIGTTAITVEEVGALERQFAALKRSLSKSRKTFRRTRTAGTPRGKRLPSRDPRWIEWVLVPLAIGQFWWLALLTSPALSAQTQCENQLPRNLVQVSIELITASLKL